MTNFYNKPNVLYLNKGNLLFQEWSNPSGLGQPVTFTALVTANAPGTGIPTGTVTFNVDGLTNEYDGTTTWRVEGNLVDVDCLDPSEDELVDVGPPFGVLEAFAAERRHSCVTLSLGILLLVKTPCAGRREAAQIRCRMV